MRESDRDAFVELLRSVAAYYDRRLTPQTMAIYWQGLADLDIDAVRAALNAHAQDPKAGQFMPKIADLRRQIEQVRDDGHPGPEEAWSIALQARHEGASVVWTDQIASAFFTAAMPLLDEGDKIAARKAFQERYEAELSQARKAGVPARWVASLGSDPEQRRQAIDQAVERGRLSSEHADKLLPRVEQMRPEALVAIENGLQSATVSREEARARARALRSMLRLP